MDKNSFESTENIYSEHENPCGRICEPFNNEYCLISQTGERLLESMEKSISRINNMSLAYGIAQSICRMHIEVINTKLDCEDNKETAEFWKSISENLTKDSLTGLYTGRGLDAFLEELYKPETLSPLIEKGYQARIIYADVNDLKSHNSGPGGHEQGDLAIATIGKALASFANNSRRKNQNLDDNRERRNSIQIPRVIAARSNEKGDEFIILSFNSSGSQKSLISAKETLDKLLSDLHYYYGDIRYNVSATFGITELRIPKNRDALKLAIKRVDLAMMEHKKLAKQHNSSVGIIVDSKKR